VGQDIRKSELAVTCVCGYEAWGSEEELVPIVQEHGIESHNVKVTYERALEMMRPGTSDAPRWAR
jgi:predicted small metal-binding protein